MTNEYYVCGDEVFIKLVHKKAGILWTIIDIEYFDLINKFKGTWYASSNDKTNYYAYGEKGKKPHRKYVSIHRLVLGLKDLSLEPDNKNRNTLDNRKNNLRPVTRSINNFNRNGLLRNNKSGMTGVFYERVRGRWWAYIELNGKRINLGYCIKKKDAIEARSKAEDAYLP